MNHDHDHETDHNYEVTDEELELLKSESEIMDAGDPAATAERLFKENLPNATLQLVKLATNASSERIRFDASRYIVERSLGRLQDLTPTADNPLEAFAQHLVDADEAAE